MSLGHGGGMGGHHGGGRGGRRAAGPIPGGFERRSRKTSRRLFREFLSAKGIFGNRKTEAELEQEAAAREEEEKRRQGEIKPKRSYVVRYLREFRDQKGRLGLLLTMSLLGIVLNAAMPLSGKFIIDFVLSRRDMTLLAGGCLVLLVIGLAEVILQTVRDYTTRSLLGNFAVRIKRRMMRHLQKLPLPRLQELKVGGIISRLQADTEGLAGLLQQGILSPFNSLLMFGVGLTSMLILSWQVTLSCIVFCVLMAGIAYVMFQVMRPLYRILREDRAVISGHLTETFGGMEVVRAFGQEWSESRDFSVETDLLWRKRLHGTVVGLVVHRMIRILFWLLRITVWLVGGYQVINGRMSIGTLVAFGSFFQWLFQPIFMIMHSLSHIQNSMACAERVFDLLDEPIDMPDKPEADEIRRLQEEIRFEKVTFRYPDGSLALDNVSFSIPCGKTTALVGPSGAGKTTVTNLVMRFYDVTDGRVLCDGKDIRDVRVGPYRQLFSLVLQDVFLFDGTVRQNISYGKANATDKEIEEAARISNSYDFVCELEDRFDTVIGERGVKLSGGQKQRIALARAVLVDPQLLILDEATSNLDTESEALIQEALADILRDRTTLVIAHRLSTIMDADNIVVLDKGKIVEEGTHEDLLSQRGRYYEMFTKQMEKTGLAEELFLWDSNSGESRSGDETGKGKRSASVRSSA